MTPDPISQTTFRRLLARTVLMPPVLFSVLSLVFLALIMYQLSAAQWVDHTDQVIAKAQALMTLFVDGETGVRGYLLTGEPMFLDPYHAEEKNVGPAFESLMELVADNSLQFQHLQVLRTEHSGWQVYARSLINLRREGGDYLTPARGGEGRRRMNAMRGQIANFIGVEKELRDSRTRTTRQATSVVIGVSLGLALLLGGVLAYFTRRQLLLVTASYRKALSEVEAQAESLRKSAHRLETLRHIDKAILAAESVLELVRSVLSRTDEVIAGGDAFVIVFDLGGGPVQVVSRSEQKTSQAMALADLGPQDFSGRDDLQAITDLAEFACRSPAQDRLFQLGYRRCMKLPIQADGRRFGVMIFVDPNPSACAPEDQEVAAEIGRQLAIAFQQARLREELQRHAVELEKRVEERTRELRETLENVKRLQGLLPICAWCKKVRDDHDYWHEVEHYVTAHTDAAFTHGICPNCFKKNFDGLNGAPFTA